MCVSALPVCQSQQSKYFERMGPSDKGMGDQCEKSVRDGLNSTHLAVSVMMSSLFDHHLYAFFRRCCSDQLISSKYVASRLHAVETC